MSSKRKPLERPDLDEASRRAQRFLNIERTAGDPPGRKEMAMTRKPRTSEKDSARLQRYLEIEKGKRA